MSVPGEGGDVTDVLFDTAMLTGTNTGVAIKALPSFVGTASNITWRNIRMDSVAEAVMVNMYNQNANMYNQNANIGTARAANLVIDSVSGTAKSAGKLLCSPGAGACTDVVMSNVHLQAGSGYTCQDVHGTASQCQPQPCLNNDY